jgi:hypothetical protein
MATDDGPAVPQLFVPILVIGLLVGVVVVLAWPARVPGGGSAGTDGGHVAGRAATSAPVPQPTGTAAGRVEAEAAALLRAWDRRRAKAWAAADASGLRALYVPGASAGEADALMLHDWRSRGLAVDALTTQLLSVRVVFHGPRRWVLLVRDRVTGAVAAGRGVAEALPAGESAERRMVLRRIGGSWRVASVRPARAPS